MSIHKRKTAKGVVYDVRVRGLDGRNYSRTFRTKKLAADFEAQQRTDMRRGTWIDPAAGAIKVADWVEHWLTSAAVSKAPSTVSTDRSVIRTAILPGLGRRRLDSIAPTEIQRLVAQWTNQVKPRTVRRRYATLAAIFNAAVESDLLARSPCRGVRLPRVAPARSHILTPADTRRLAQELPAEYRAMVYLGVLLGLRFGEVAGLRVGRVDFERCTLHVEEAIAEASGHIYVKEPKTQRSRRALPISEALARILKQHFADHGLFGGPADAWVFATRGGGPLSRTRFRSRVWVPACRRAGLEGVGFHDLRRTNATALVFAGASIRDAQDLLGHEDPRTLLTIYAHATSAGQRDAVDRISAALVAEPDPPA